MEATAKERPAGRVAGGGAAGALLCDALGKPIAVSRRSTCGASGGGRWGDGVGPACMGTACGGVLPLLLGRRAGASTCWGNGPSLAMPILSLACFTAPAIGVVCSVACSVALGSESRAVVAAHNTALPPHRPLRRVRAQHACGMPSSSLIKLSFSAIVSDPVAFSGGKGPPAMGGG